MTSYYSSGQLLLTGEYFVLKGAKAFALPTVMGQTLYVSQATSQKDMLVWKSYDVDGKVWFWARFSNHLELIETSSPSKAILIQRFLTCILDQKPSKFEVPLDFNFYLDFPLTWGLGSSATLIANLSQWSEIDPYLLLEIMGGSGYDVACALASTPVLYDLQDRAEKLSNFDYPFHTQLYFLHLNRKVSSSQSVSKHFIHKNFPQKKIDEVTEMTSQLIKVSSLDDFSLQLNRYDDFISNELGLPTVRQEFFPDYPYPMKYLGAWGGDFCLVVMPDVGDKGYFFDKGFHTMLSFDEMIQVGRHRKV